MLRLGQDIYIQYSHIKTIHRKLTSGDMPIVRVYRET